MLSCEVENSWLEFLTFAKKRCSAAEFKNWLEPIKRLDSAHDEIVLEVPNIFVQQYLLDNYKQELSSFFPTDTKGEPKVRFQIAQALEKKPLQAISLPKKAPTKSIGNLNHTYTFENFIEGPSNQFVKSAAVGVASRPGKSFNPFFIHGGVGLGKTHLLHGIGHFIQKNHKKLRIQYITTEGFINDLVDSLRNKSVDQMKRYYRNLDVLLIDDIQFLQNRLNFEEEFVNTFESLIHQNKQIVMTSDKPPSQLKLSERMVARMEWGLVAHIGIPDLETRVAIIQHKAEKRGISIPHSVAFFIAEHIYNNVRQIEGAINRLSAYCRLMKIELNKELAESILSEMLQHALPKKVTIDHILHCVGSFFQVRVNDLKGESRQKEIALPRQVAMYLAKELISESLMKIADSFGGRTHSTLLYAWEKIKEQMEKDPLLKRKVDSVVKNLESL